MDDDFSGLGLEELVDETFSPPERLGHYEVGPLLGEGGMGLVYRGYDSALARRLAIKFLRPTLCRDAGAVRRFQREARLAAGLSHTNLVAVHHFGCVANVPFIIQEFVDGSSLAELIDEGPLPAERCRALMLQAARGLAAVNDVGVVHRDVKPANLVVRHDGILKITDFGLSRNAGDTMELTAPGDVIGTPEFIAPELVTGEGCDHRTDVYGLGATFYAAVTGCAPFSAPTALELAFRHVTGRLVPVRLRNRRVPGRLAAIIERCMEPHPDRRYQTWNEVITALERAATKDLEAPRPRVKRPEAARPTVEASGAPTGWLAGLAMLADQALALARGSG